MDTILETVGNLLETVGTLERVSNAHDEAIREGRDRPRPEWVRGVCPQCGEEVVSNIYYVPGRGYLCLWQCWASLGENPTCEYRKVV